MVVGVIWLCRLWQCEITQPPAIKAISHPQPLRYLYIYIYIFIAGGCVCVHICMYVCMYVCMCNGQSLCF